MFPTGLGLAENVPADVVDALSGRRHAWQKLVHVSHSAPYLLESVIACKHLTGILSLQKLTLSRLRSPQHFV